MAARLVQAVATGLYFPVVNEALLNLSPKNGAGRLLAVNSGIIGIGLAVAPIVAGLVITYWGLRVLFAIPTVAHSSSFSLRDARSSILCRVRSCPSTD